MKKILSVIISSLFLVTTIQAQDYSPDRPGIGNGSFITPQNVFGVEAGLQYTTTEFTDQIDIGQVLLRYGVAEKLELRALINSYVSTTFDGPVESISGFQDMSLGIKYNFIEGNGNTSVSGLAEFSFPVGSDEYSNDEVVPSIVILADQSVNEIWGVSSNFGYNFGPGNLDDNWFYTFTPSFLLPSNERIAGYFGYAGMYFGNSFNRHWVEGGFTYALESGAQLDVNLGYETEGEIFFIGAGFAKGF